MSVANGSGPGKSDGGGEALNIMARALESYSCSESSALWRRRWLHATAESGG